MSTVVLPTEWSTSTAYTSTVYGATTTLSGSESDYGTGYPTAWTIGTAAYNTTVTASDATATWCDYSGSETNTADNIFLLGCKAANTSSKITSKNGAGEVGNISATPLLILVMLGALFNFI